jgi:UDP-N-acetylmuramate--alanine ligase
MSATHFIGIGGTGLSAIARVLLERGEIVTGSDQQDSPLAEALRQAGVRVSIGHAAENVNGAGRVVRSSAVPDDNVEVQAALARGIPVLKRSEFLEELLASQNTIAIAGSHGKTTTTGMVAWMLSALDQDPGYIIGSVAPNLGSNAAAGGGRYFVIEADEYDYMFHGLHPSLALVTNVEHDHPDFFKTPEDFVAAFQGFVDRVKDDGALIICLDDPGAAALGEYARSQGIRVVSYGFTAGADYCAVGLEAGERGFKATAVKGEAALAHLHLQVPGAHNAQNALGALVVADLLGLNVAEAALALDSFQGTGRRFELRGAAAGVLVVDDYAHHPTEIRAVLAAARAQFPERRLWALWQPHTYSRTLTLLDDFGAAFSDASHVVVLPVYAAREQAPADFEYEQVLHAVQHAHVHGVADFEDALQLFADELADGDLVLMMSAGDAIQLSERLFAQLQVKEQA